MEYCAKWKYLQWKREELYVIPSRKIIYLKSNFNNTSLLNNKKEIDGLV